MADTLSNVIKGAFAEKVRDDATKVGVLLLKTAQSDANLKDHATVAAMLAAGGGTANVECDFTNYARKTGITATLTVDNTADYTWVDIPDQTWTNAGGATNNTTAKLVVFYEDAAADATRIPVGFYDFVATTDGNDLIAQVNASGIYRAA